MADLQRLYGIILEQKSAWINDPYVVQALSDGNMRRRLAPLIAAYEDLGKKHAKRMKRLAATVLEQPVVNTFSIRKLAQVLVLLIHYDAVGDAFKRVLKKVPWYDRRKVNGELDELSTKLDMAFLQRADDETVFPLLVIYGKIAPLAVQSNAFLLTLFKFGNKDERELFFNRLGFVAECVAIIEASTRTFELDDESDDLTDPMPKGKRLLFQLFAPIMFTVFSDAALQQVKSEYKNYNPSGGLRKLQKYGLLRFAPSLGRLEDTCFKTLQIGRKSNQYDALVLFVRTWLKPIAESRRAGYIKRVADFGLEIDERTTNMEEYPDQGPEAGPVLGVDLLLDGDPESNENDSNNRKNSTDSSAEDDGGNGDGDIPSDDYDGDSLTLLERLAQFRDRMLLISSYQGMHLKARILRNRDAFPKAFGKFQNKRATANINSPLLSNVGLPDVGILMLDLVYLPAASRGMGIGQHFARVLEQAVTRSFSAARPLGHLVLNFVHADMAAVVDRRWKYYSYYDESAFLRNAQGSPNATVATDWFPADLDQPVLVAGYWHLVWTHPIVAYLAAPAVVAAMKNAEPMAAAGVRDLLRSLNSMLAGDKSDPMHPTDLSWWGHDLPAARVLGIYSLSLRLVPVRGNLKNDVTVGQLRALGNDDHDPLMVIVTVATMTEDLLFPLLDLLIDLGRVWARPIWFQPFHHSDQESKTEVDLLWASTYNALKVNFGLCLQTMTWTDARGTDSDQMAGVLWVPRPRVPTEKAKLSVLEPFGEHFTEALVPLQQYKNDDPLVYSRYHAVVM